MHLFTDDEKILSKLSEKGNPLERLDAVMDWNIFLPLLSELFSRKDKVISRGGRPHLDYLMMFKALLLQRLHNLSDDAMEYQLLDRISFRRFVGCHEDTVPDAKTIWLYREKLTKSGREKELFDLFYAHLTDEGVIAHSGQIVDATLSNALNNAIHVRTIRKSKLIENYEVTTASVHDSNVLAPLCDANEAVLMTVLMLENQYQKVVATTRFVVLLEINR